MPDFRPIITLAYQRILRRLPDPGGLEDFNRQMNAGLTEATMREILIRSPEYAQKNPDRAVRTASKASTRARASRARARKAR
jgi:hypothetical protein